MIVHLNGWPGVGKRTVGYALAARLGARFVHNHVLHDVAIACCGYDDPDRWDLYDQVRRAAYEALVRRPRGETFVMTNALCDGCAREEEAWRHVVALAERRRVPLVPVVLEADPAENERRIQAAERVGRKMTDPLHLRSIMASHRIQKPDGPDLFVLDVTALPPDEAARRIAQHLSELRARGSALSRASGHGLRTEAGTGAAPSGRT